MSKKDYVLVAKVLAKHRQGATPGLRYASADVIDDLAYDLAHEFKVDNPNFDGARFLAAVGDPR
jgi:hypothetical protein